MGAGDSIMKKLIAIWIISFICYSAEARNLMVVGGGVPAAGGASPSWQWDFEDNTTCTDTGKFDGVNGVPSCQSTTQALGTYDMSLASGGTTYAYKTIAMTGTELWIEYSTYTDNVNFSDAAARVFLDVCTAADGSSYALRVGMENDTTYKYFIYRWGSSSYTRAGSPTVGRLYWRWYFKKDNTTGITKLSTSTNGSDWAEAFNTTGVDTDTSIDWVRINFGRNNNANKLENWYFDNIKIYYSDPAW
jgi:hypothetical protein